METEAPASQAQARPKRLEDLESRSWCESLCSCFLRAPEITDEDRDIFWELRDHHCNMLFERDSPEATELLVGIWNLLRPTERISSLSASAHWQELGFQSGGPQSDVRTGRFAPEQLHYLAYTYPNTARTLVKQALELDYPFAISCFNVTHMLLVFFDLFNGETVSPVAGAAPADRAQMKHFASLCRRSPYGARGVLDELFCILVESLHEIWKDMRTTQNCNLMDFPRALEAVYRENARCWSRQQNELAELRDALIPHS